MAGGHRCSVLTIFVILQRFNEGLFCTFRRLVCCFKVGVRVGFTNGGDKQVFCRFGVLHSRGVEVSSLPVCRPNTNGIIVTTIFRVGVVHGQEVGGDNLRGRFITTVKGTGSFFGQLAHLYCVNDGYTHCTRPVTTLLRLCVFVFGPICTTRRLRPRSGLHRGFYRGVSTTTRGVVVFCSTLKTFKGVVHHRVRGLPPYIFVGGTVGFVI